jgi:hypothetical protein
MVGGWCNAWMDAGTLRGYVYYCYGQACACRMATCMWVYTRSHSMHMIIIIVEHII